MIFITYKTTDTAVISFVFSSGIIEGRVYKAFVYISVFKILNFIRQLFIFSTVQ
jgi:hypothetical protein